ncbi:peptidase inhibitor family I36 protein [Streptomyces sp. NPDC059985]|uniref:peptidase inhibitor family I36 protein n=1 Tax=Streptomyces sp. NPDC059985 TaxID=3347025 RepID=UPI0036C4E095
MLEGHTGKANPRSREVEAVLAHLRFTPTACAIVALLALSVTPASAADTSANRTTQDVANCPSNYVCLYRDSGLRGGGYGVMDGHDLNDLSALDFDNQLSSWANATTDRYCWYSDVNFAGFLQEMPPGTAADLQGAQLNDVASSVVRC